MYSYRKPEALMKTTPKLLPAVLRNTMGCLTVCVHKQCICKLYNIHNYIYI